MKSRRIYLRGKKKKRKKKKQQSVTKSNGMKKVFSSQRKNKQQDACSNKARILSNKYAYAHYAYSEIICILKK